MRRLGLLAVVLLAIPAPQAQAATVAVDGQTLRFTAEGGEANFATFHHRAEDEFVIYDPRFPGQPVTAGAGCAQDGDNTVICPRGAVTRAEFALADGGEDEADSLTLTAALPVQVAVSAEPGTGAHVRYIDLRPLSVTLDGQPNDGPAGRGDDIGAGVDHVSGGDGTDTLGGNSRANRLNGDNGGDVLGGAGGNDTLTAASYNDVGLDAIGLETRGADTVACGTGRDVVFYDASDAVADDCELHVVVSDSGFRFEGTAGADRIVADRGPATVRGRGGNDRLGASRGIGAVRIFGDAGADRVAGNVDSDTLSGGSGDDLIFGAEGDDRINPGSGRDTVSGGANADRIGARDGSADRITCGSGRDTVTADRRDRVAGDCERVSYR